MVRREQDAGQSILSSRQHVPHEERRGPPRAERLLQAAKRERGEVTCAHGNVPSLSLPRASPGHSRVTVGESSRLPFLLAIASGIGRYRYPEWTTTARQFAMLRTETLSHRQARVVRASASMYLSTMANFRGKPSPRCRYGRRSIGCPGVNPSVHRGTPIPGFSSSLADSSRYACLPDAVVGRTLALVTVATRCLPND